MGKNTYQLYIQIGNEKISPIADSETSQKPALTTTQKVGAGIFTAYQVADPFIKKTQQILINNVQTEYANEELEQRIGLLMDTANFAVKTGANLAGGASLAQALGLGAGAGLMAGLVVSLASIAMDFAVKANQINNQIKIDNEQLGILRGRNGMQFNRSRGGE